MRLLLLYFAAIILAGSVDTVQAQAKITRSSKIVFIDDRPFYFHTVSRGETLFSISKAYDVSEETIIEYNRFVRNGLKTKQTLKIPAKEETTTTQKQPKSDATVKSQSSTQTTAAAPKTSGKTTDNSIKKESQQPEKQTAKTTPPPTQDTETEDIESEQADSVDVSGMAIGSVKRELGEIKSFNVREPIDVTLMLPFNSGGKGQPIFTEFYQGVIIALEEMKKQGISVDLNVYDTKRSASTIADILRKCEQTNIILGPIYEEEFEPVMEFASRNNIPVISPLGSVNNLNTPLLYQAAPSDETKYIKLKRLLESPDKNVFFIKPSISADSEFINEISSILPSTTHRIEYSLGTPTSSIAQLLDDKRDNIFIVASSSENKVEEILSRISSINAQALGKWKMSVVGTPKWARFANIEMSLFFKMNLRYVTSYHADRSAVTTSEFFNQYMELFGSMPSLYSYRGYDVAKFFITAMYENGPRFPLSVGQHSPTLLQVPYRFGQKDRQSKFENTEWVVVNYTPDYRIVVE